MPLPTSLPIVRDKAGSQGSGNVYVCLNAFCRYRAYEKLPECPECGRVGKFLPSSDVAARNLALGLMFLMFGGVILLFGLFFLIGAASGSLNADTGYLGTFAVIGVGVVFIVSGISAVVGYTWLFWLLRLLLW